MAGRTPAARHVDVRILETMTIQTLSDDGVAHRHPRRADRHVAGRALSIERAVRGVLRCHCDVMRLMCETQIAGARAGTRNPVDAFLDDAVVTRCAACRLREERTSRFDNTGMTARAEWENLRVLLVRKAIASNWRFRGGDERLRHHEPGGDRRVPARQ